jgi:hypothetical protein
VGFPATQGGRLRFWMAGRGARGRHGLQRLICCGCIRLGSASVAVIRRRCGPTSRRNGQCCGGGGGAAGVSLPERSTRRLGGGCGGPAAAACSRAGGGVGSGGGGGPARDVCRAAAARRVGGVGGGRTLAGARAHGGRPCPVRAERPRGRIQRLVGGKRGDGADRCYSGWTRPTLFWNAVVHGQSQ